MKTHLIRNLGGLLLLSSLLLLPVGCNDDRDLFYDSPLASNYASESITAWFDLALDLIQTTPGVSPPVAARALGYMGVTAYEAVASGFPGHNSLAGQLTDLQPGDLPAPDREQQYHWPSVVNGALALVVEYLFFNAAPEGQYQIASLNSRIENRFRKEVDLQTHQRSLQHGKQLGEAIISWATQDTIGHQGQLKNFPAGYIRPTGPDKWTPTGPQVIPLQPYWGKARTFVPNCASMTQPPAPLPFSEMPSSAFYQEAMTVYTALNEHAGEKKIIAEYWADGGGTITPPGHSVSIALQLVRKEKLNLAETAKLMAQLSMAVNDAFVSCWFCKFQFNLLRPQSYIQKYIDPNWSPLLPTPPFPEYTSGHSTQSGAASVILTAVFGENFRFQDNTHLDRTDINGKPRDFSSFQHAAQEAAVSRLYGGIHYPMGNEQGLSQGVSVGREVLKLRFE